VLFAECCYCSGVLLLALLLLSLLRFLCWYHTTLAQPVNAFCAPRTPQQQLATTA
jgi:hypothetical protein